MNSLWPSDLFPAQRTAKHVLQEQAALVVQLSDGSLQGGVETLWHFGQGFTYYLWIVGPSGRHNVLMVKNYRSAYPVTVQLMASGNATWTANCEREFEQALRAALQSEEVRTLVDTLLHS